MKKAFLILFVVPLIASSQNYVDLLKIGYGQTFNNDFVGVEGSTSVKSFEVDLTVPIPINDRHAFVTGISFNRNNLQLYPINTDDTDYYGVDENNETTLYSTLLKIGLASTYNEKWSSTIILLPKIASDYKQVNSNDFYLGGLALLKYQKTENLKYRFGFYASSEAFGFFTTPIIGWYYLSPDSKFEMDISLPIASDINYSFGNTTVGVDYFGIGRSFRLYEDSDESEAYVDLSSLEFSSYLQFNLMEKSVLLRAKFGYSSDNYEVYSASDKIDLGISAFSFGDDRTQLNPDISGGLFLRFEAIYRFNIIESVDNSQLEKRIN